MRNIENTAVNDLILRASDGRRHSESMEAVDGDADGDPDDEATQLTLPVGMPVAAPFERRRTTAPYPVVRRGPAVTTSPVVTTSPAWPPSTAPEFLEPASPRRLYEKASQVERSESGGRASRGINHEHDRVVPTFQIRRSEVRSIVARLVFPIALLVSIGIVVGAYVAFSRDRGAARGDLSAAAPVAASPEVPTAAPPAAPVAAPVAPPAPPAPTVTAAPAAPHAAPAAPAAAALPAAPASPETVDVRIDSIPAGATVMLIDRGRTQLIGDTPIDTAVDPSREYDLVFTSASAPPHVEHLDPRTMRRVEVALGKQDSAHPADAPRRAEHVAAERAAADHAPAAHAHRSRPRPEPPPEPPVGQGTLMISSKPPCEIVIDGRTTGLTTPQRSISLSAGDHRIMLFNSEMSIHKVVSVQIIANTTAKIIEDLMQ